METGNKPSTINGAVFDVVLLKINSMRMFSSHLLNFFRKGYVQSIIFWFLVAGRQQTFQYLKVALHSSVVVLFLPKYSKQIPHYVYTVCRCITVGKPEHL